MKYIVMAISLFIISPVTARANSLVRPQAVTSVMGSASSSYTVTGLSIAATTPTSIVIDVAQMFKQVCAQNLSTTNALYCGETVNVSSATTNAVTLANHGVVVPPAASATAPNSPTCFSIVAGTNFYCRSGGVAGTTSNAVIIRAR